MLECKRVNMLLYNPFSETETGTEMNLMGRHTERTNKRRDNGKHRRRCEKMDRWGPERDRKRASDCAWDKT